MTGQSNAEPVAGIDANDLLLFARVIELGSFSRAAERLGCPKSTVSRRIAELERRLGERLLQRTTRKLTITDFGLGVLDHARQVAQEVDAAMALAQHRQARPSGRLRVSMPGDFASVALPDLLARFVQAHPAVQLELDLSPRQVDLIGEGYDIAIRMGELPADSQLAARRLALFSMSLYAAPDFLARHGEPQEPEVLTSLHGLMVSNRAGEARPWQLFRPGADGLQEWQGLPEQRTLANSPDVLMRLALRGSGVVAVPDYFAEALVARGDLVRLLPDWSLAPAACSAVFPGRRLMPAKTRAFIDLLAEELRTAPEVEARCAEVERQRRAAALVPAD
ncbi:LysR family transcriptional regulator [Aquabacterium sp. J223]|uniref:LysR family transcriptional regulator n=1 Tax=Aquabacterium sp. J223 TaxID=2898431 RepID=UPI0021ADC090|nr:LysR family transcriptional regulator [Aquabacterium sp. J223]UUX96213.1 LysR family transcriptional regulator [Aquabacterium sp. J223]